MPDPITRPMSQPAPDPASGPERAFVQKGASAHFDVAFDGQTETFHFLLLPKTTMLAVAAAIEPLRIANQISEQPLYNWYTLSETGAPITCSNGMRITPDKALDSLPKDALCFVCGGVEPERNISKQVLAWMRREARFGRRFGGICTGAFALAAAGLIKNQYFTLHWENQPRFQEDHPELTPTDRLFEIDNGLITCGGGNASIDMMLALMERRHGARLAAVVADMCLHGRATSAKSSQTTAAAAAIGSRNPHLLAALELMRGEVETPLSMSEICAQLGVSRRQIERLFLRHIGQPPMQCYLELRLARARSYLKETNMTVADVAAATGFSSSNHFTKRFKERYGRTPRSYRVSWN
ncbi:GlxA family transcriptional regulator [uncultured Lentibacter sp.]|uniref:GlxA family transcriptional regulator n=1 Tax=uncultured Lentibacter sp. TaxID=1659309 RepID=UPI002622D137|nr:GlxA family transcriptional regulator [uncultured Lentibacter sp.]